MIEERLDKEHNMGVASHGRMALKEHTTWVLESGRDLKHHITQVASNVTELGFRAVYPSMGIVEGEMGGLFIEQEIQYTCITLLPDSILSFPKYCTTISNR